jgi:hypothetical protein
LATEKRHRKADTEKLAAEKLAAAAEIRRYKDVTETARKA